MGPRGHHCAFPCLSGAPTAPRHWDVGCGRGGEEGPSESTFVVGSEAAAGVRGPRERLHALRGHLLPPTWPKPEGQHPAQVIPVSVQSGKVGRGPTRSFQILPQDLLPEHRQRKAPPPEHRDLWAGRPSASSRGLGEAPPGGRAQPWEAGELRVCASVCEFACLPCMHGCSSFSSSVDRLIDFFHKLL